MPYDPTPLGDRESLTVQVEGARGDAERLYVIGRPRDGVVEVREIVGGCAPVEYAERADVLRDRFERLGRERRRLSADLYLIRNWLDGRA
jgi:hypothetical protein